MDISGTVLIDFYADWCQPCKQMEPVLKAFEKDTGIPVVKINADDETDLVATYNIMSLPTFLFYKNGVQEARVSGAKSLEKLKEVLGL